MTGRIGLSKSRIALFEQCPKRLWLSVHRPQLAETLLRKLIPQAEAMTTQQLAPVLLCGPTIRRHLQAFIRRTIPTLSVILVNEIPMSIGLRSFSLVTPD